MIIQEICESFQKELLLGLHNISIHEFYLALFCSDKKATKNIKSYYDIEDIELLNEGNYNKGGQRIENISLYIKGDLFLIHFDNIIFKNASFETTGGIIYNNSLPTKNSISIFNFSEKIITNSNDFKLMLEQPKKFKKIL